MRPHDDGVVRRIEWPIRIGDADVPDVMQEDAHICLNYLWIVYHTSVLVGRTLLIERDANASRSGLAELYGDRHLRELVDHFKHAFEVRAAKLRHAQHLPRQEVRHLLFLVLRKSTCCLDCLEEFAEKGCKLRLHVTQLMLDELRV